MTKETDANPSVAGRKRQWCRENFLNHSRLQTAVKVRAQLKGIVKSAGLGTLHTCGADDLTPLTKAFFEVAFRDQVRFFYSSPIAYLNSLSISSSYFFF